MDAKKIEKFLELLAEIVGESGKTYVEKRDGILDEASPEDRGNIEEFATWFAE